MNEYKYPIGTMVKKKTGYLYPGIVVATFEKLNGEQRYVIESLVPDVLGMLHIFSEKDLEETKND